MSNAKNDFIIPILVLTIICIITSVALAATQEVTAPIIAEAERVAAEAARQEVLPGATTFTLVDSLEDMPENVTAIYEAENGVVVEVSVKGYAGDIKTMFGIGMDGNIVKSKVLLHSETAGLGSKITEDDFQSQFAGKGSSLEGIDTIGGATVSSKAFIDASNIAFEAYSILNGGTASDSVAGATEATDTEKED